MASVAEERPPLETVWWCYDAGALMLFGHAEILTEIAASRLLEKQKNKKDPPRDSYHWRRSCEGKQEPFSEHLLVQFSNQCVA